MSTGRRGVAARPHLLPLPRRHFSSLRRAGVIATRRTHLLPLRRRHFPHLRRAGVSTGQQKPILIGVPPFFFAVCLFLASTRSFTMPLPAAAAAAAVNRHVASFWFRRRPCGSSSSAFSSSDMPAGERWTSRVPGSIWSKCPAMDMPMSRSHVAKQGVRGLDEKIFMQDTAKAPRHPPVFLCPVARTKVASPRGSND